MEKKKESIAISLIALIIGILALLLSWVPIVNNLAAIFAIIAFIFGIIAIIVNRKNKKTLAIVGLVVSVISFAIVMATQAYYGSKIDKAFNKSDSTTKTKESKNETKKENSGWDDSTKTFTGFESIIKIDKVEKGIKNYQKKPVVKIYYTLTNNISKMQKSYDMIQDMMTVQQKSKNTTNNLHPVFWDSSDENSDKTHLEDNVNPNGTISGFSPYELENETDPIQITFKKGNDIVATYEVAIN